MEKAGWRREKDEQIAAELRYSIDTVSRGMAPGQEKRE